MRLFADLETYSPVPIKNGTWKYAEQAEILLFGYAIDDEPAKVWDLTTGAPMPDELKTALETYSCETVWHNGMMFDTIILKKVLGIDIEPSRVVDTMVLAYQAALPGSLAELCDVLQVPTDLAKDKEGWKLVQLFCKPLPKNYKLARATRDTHPEDWANFVNYCRLDVEAERALWKKIPKFQQEELLFARKEHSWQVIDAEINRRGMLMDVELAEAAVKTDFEQKKALNAKLLERTGGRVETVGQRDELMKFFKDYYDVELPNMTKAELEKRIEDPDIPEPVREMIRDRLAGCRTSVQKYKAILDRTSSDGRMRGNLQFRGASRTGRFSGRGFQPQNLPRPKIKDPQVIENAIAVAKAGMLDVFYDDPGEMLSQCLRGVIIAPEGKKLVVADYSNVEGRVLAWLAGETWKLQAFRDFDAGHGHDLYKLTYAKAFNVDPESVTKDQRQMGKVLELALGYGGGAGAFATFARGYGVDLHDMADKVVDAIDPAIWREAENSYESYFLPRKRTEGMERKVFIACDAVKRAWRRANPKIVELWNSVGEAIDIAMEKGNAKVTWGVRMEKRGAWLLLRLPSGRRLCYPSPRIGDGDNEPAFSYMGVEQFSRKWKRIASYGPKVVENMTQAVSCDLLTEALARLSRHGYKAVLTVHDEVIAEAVDNEQFSFKKMAEVMAETPEWATGLPLAAAGFEAHRYRKE